MKKILSKVNKRYLYLALAISFGLNIIHCHYLSTKYHCPVAEISNVVGFNLLSVIFGIVELAIGCALCFKVINTDLSYISEESNKFTFEKSFILGDFSHIFCITIDLNQWENIKFAINLLFPAIVIIISIISLIFDCLLFFKV